jgi:hypothetical protein
MVTIMAMCAAEHEHHLRITPRHRACIGMRKGGVKPRVADRNRKPNRLDRKIRKDQTQHQRDRHDADHDPVEQKKPPRDVNVVWYGQRFPVHAGSLCSNAR